VLVLSTLVAFIIKKLITDPIIKLKSKVEKNDLEFETANQKISYSSPNKKDNI
jgi:hypothetical protein